MLYYVCINIRSLIPGDEQNGAENMPNDDNDAGLTFDDDDDDDDVDSSDEDEYDDEEGKTEDEEGSEADGEDKEIAKSETFPQKILYHHFGTNFHDKPNL